MKELVPPFHSESWAENLWKKEVEAETSSLLSKEFLNYLELCGPRLVGLLFEGEDFRCLSLEKRRKLPGFGKLRGRVFEGVALKYLKSLELTEEIIPTDKFRATGSPDAFLVNTYDDKVVVAGSVEIKSSHVFKISEARLKDQNERMHNLSVFFEDPKYRDMIMQNRAEGRKLEISSKPIVLFMTPKDVDLSLELPETIRVPIDSEDLTQLCASIVLNVYLKSL